MNFDKWQFAERLASRRKELDLTMWQLTDRTHGQVTPSQISRFEKGVRLPSTSALFALAKALEMSIDDLVSSDSSFDKKAPETGQGLS